MKVVFSGGGTAGHIMPGIAVGRRIVEEFPGTRVLFFTLQSDVGFKPLAESGFELEAVSSGGVLGKSFPSAALSAGRFFGGFLKALLKLKKLNPDVIIGCGGYASAPAVAAGIVLGKKVVLLEQNRSPGLVTRIFGRLADEVELSFPAGPELSGRAFRVKITGNPVRKEIISADRGDSMARLGLFPSVPVLAVLGGSSGSESLNRAVENLMEKSRSDGRLKAVLSSWQFIHITGEDGYHRVRRAYAGAGIKAKVFPFLEQVWHVYACADAVLSRSGGNSFAEITARCIPAVYVPYPWAGGHQEQNARSAFEAGAAVMVRDEALLTDEFSSVLLSVMSDASLREEMASAAELLPGGDAAGQVVKNIMEIIGKRDDNRH